MSGVIDKDGQQWERCNVCRTFVRMQLLRYEKPSTLHKYGRDLCGACYLRIHGEDQPCARCHLVVVK